ncbi:MAG: PAS domain S-box protein [Smithella sp.]
MKDESKTKKQLISELAELRQQLANTKNFEEEFNKLKENNAKFVKAFMNCSIPVTITTFKEGRFIDVNNAFLRFTGLRQDEVIGSTSREIGYISEEQRAVLFSEIKKKGCVENLELNVGAKGRDVKAGLFNVVMMTINNERCLLKVMVDITERKKAEHALRESEQKYRKIIEDAGEGIYQTTPEGRCLMANQSLVSILGYESPAEFISDVDDIGSQLYVDPSRRLEIKRLLSENGTVKDFKTRLIRKDKKTIWATINARAIRNEEGNILGYQGTIFDESEKKNLETRRLQAKKMEAVSTFAGGLAQDFNDILLVIQECVSMMLLDMDSSHSHHRYLKIIETQVANGADIAAKLLGIARLGRYAVNPANIDDIIEKTSYAFRNIKKKISMHQESGQELEMVAVDWDQMEQVFMTIYENAWQSMPEGGKIYIKTEPFLMDYKKAFPHTAKEGKYVKISIADTGVGMDESTKERIFDPFFAAKGRGGGLELTTVYSIIKGHEGTIDVYSEPGQGTTFTIYLPT